MTHPDRLLLKLRALFKCLLIWVLESMQCRLKRFYRSRLLFEIYKISLVSIVSTQIYLYMNLSHASAECKKCVIIWYHSQTYLCPYIWFPLPYCSGFSRFPQKCLIFSSNDLESHFFNAYQCMYYIKTPTCVHISTSRTSSLIVNTKN